MASWPGTSLLAVTNIPELVVWIGARFAVQGRITAGELVAFYGYAAFLLIPLRTATEFANKWIRAMVAARRVIRLLALEPDGMPEAGQRSWVRRCGVRSDRRSCAR